LLIDEGRSQEAVTLLNQAAGDSASPEIYDLLGDAYAQSKDFTKSEEAYRKAVQDDPDDPTHVHGLAQALLSQDKYAEALALYRKSFHGATPSGAWAVAYYETEAAVPSEMPQAVAGLRGQPPDHVLRLERAAGRDPQACCMGM